MPPISPTITKIPTPITAPTVIATAPPTPSFFSK
jgi:hypothetical protein